MQSLFRKDGRLNNQAKYYLIPYDEFPNYSFVKEQRKKVKRRTLKKREFRKTKCDMSIFG